METKYTSDGKLTCEGTGRRPSITSPDHQGVMHTLCPGCDAELVASDNGVEHPAEVTFVPPHLPMEERTDVGDDYYAPEHPKVYV